MANKYCFHCSGSHSPNYRNCSRYKLEQSIVITANDEYISFGSARKKLLGGNKSKGSSYAKVVSDNPGPSQGVNIQPSSANIEVSDCLPSVSANSHSNSEITSNLNKGDLTSIVVSAEIHKSLPDLTSLPSDSLSEPRNTKGSLSRNKAPQHIARTGPQIQTCIRSMEETPTTPSTSRGSSKIASAPEINIYNRYTALASLGDHDGNIDFENCDNVTVTSVLPKNTGGKRRVRGSGTPPKAKKLNTTDVHIHPHLDNRDLMEVQINIGEIHKSPQPLLQHEFALTQFDPEHQAVEAKVKELSMNNKSYIEALTPSPIIGKTGKSLIDPKPQSTEISPLQASSVIMDSSLNPGDTNKSHTIPHKPSCGCHQCFVDKLTDIKEMSTRSCTILIDNFIKYKAKNQYGDLEEHAKDCMCVDHLMKIRNSDSFAIPNLLEKIKQRQGTAIPKRLNNKLNTKNPMVQQKFVSTKVSRNNILLDRTPSSK